jgi:hypothetical protein
MITNIYYYIDHYDKGGSLFMSEENKIVGSEEPFIRGNIIIFKCPKRNCNVRKFILNEDGTVDCACGEKIIKMVPNHLIKHFVPGVSHMMTRGDDFEIIEGSNKDRMSVLSTYLSKTKDMVEENRIYDSYIRKLLFRNTVSITDIEHKKSIQRLLSKFDISYKCIGSSIFLNMQ